MKYDLIEHDQSHGYRLGIRILEMGTIIRDQQRVGQIAYPFLVELRDASKETAILVVNKGKRSLILREVEGTHPISFRHNEGRTLPLHTAAGAKILLAYLPAEQQDEIISHGLRRYNKNTITVQNQVFSTYEITEISCPSVCLPSTSNSPDVPH